MIQGLEAVSSAVRTTSENRGDTQGFKELKPRGESDPMKLYLPMLEELDNHFSIRNLTNIYTGSTGTVG